jgi:transitional endoplasmic reticulum ATPase
MEEKNNFKDEVDLIVAEALQDDVNSGFVRIDSSYLKFIGVSPGQPVGIRGEKETIAIAQRAYPSDLGLDIIRMDGTVRKNAKISLGEKVKIFKPKISKGKKVTLAPLGDFIPHPTILANLKKGLEGKPVKQGDIISIKGNNYQKKSISHEGENPFVIDLFYAIENEFLGFNLSSIKFKVVQTDPKEGFILIENLTEILISNKETSEEGGGVNYEDIGGLKSQLLKVRELVELPLKHPELFTRLGIDAPKGILLYGPPGTGKTLLARAIANETEASFFSINAPEIVNKYYGESEKKLREIFEKAEKNSPSIIFIDELDAIAVKREEVQGETEKRIVAQLLTLMDGLKKNKNVIVIAATNRPDVLDEALRRPGRFDRELEIGVPKEQDRYEILKIHTRGIPFELPEKFSSYQTVIKSFKKKYSDLNIDLDKLKEVLEKDKFQVLKILPEEIVQRIRKKEGDKILKVIAKVTHGFVGADLEALVKEAAFNVLRRTFPSMNFDKDIEIPKETLLRLEITKNDFVVALKTIRPSAMREFLVEVPDVKWEDIGGLDEIKQSLTEMIEWPLKYPDSFRRLGIKPPKGILLYGPPGTGKTLLAKAVATETSSNFIYVKGPEIINKFVGESEKMIRKLFEKARQNSPSILFFDEFDAIASTRMGSERQNNTETVVNQILTEMDGIEDLVNVKVIAATNRPNLIDPALLRPGRFDKLVLVDIPNEEARKEIFKINLKDVPIENKEQLIQELSSKTEGYVGADIEALVREAGLIALRRDISSEELKKEDFLEALEKIKPSINSKLRDYYKKVETEMKNPKPEKQENLSMNSYM